MIGAGIGRLYLITNQSRFLVLEPTPNLASRTLSLLARQVVRDWPLRFGHPVLLMETFVDPARFKGTCYRAANWMPISETAEFRRIRGGYQRGSSSKVLFVRLLHKNARQLLAGAHLDSHYYRNGVCHKLYSGEYFKILLDYFSATGDPRRVRGQRYRLETQLAIAATTPAAIRKSASGCRHSRIRFSRSASTAAKCSAPVSIAFAMCWCRSTLSSSMVCFATGAFRLTEPTLPSP